MEPNLDIRYFCLDHGLWYEELVSICPKCEEELSEPHDQYLEEKKDDL